jgi:branched-chain amino acid transport system ATP-binding protein
VIHGSGVFCCNDIHIRLGGRPILEGVSLSVDAGQVLGLVGPNGAGKTTLLEVLSGRYRAQHGRVSFDGRDITRLPLYARARLGIARTYQSPVVPEALTIGQVLEAARQAFSPILTGYHAEWAVEKVRLRASSDTMAAALDTLSRRKLLLACLLMRRPRVMLLDEPAAGLINAEVDEIDSLIRYFAREMQMAVIVVEHRLELLSAIADEVVVLDLGRLIAHGSPESVFEESAVRAAYFDFNDGAVAVPEQGRVA